MNYCCNLEMCFDLRCRKNDPYMNIAQIILYLLKYESNFSLQKNE